MKKSVLAILAFILPVISIAQETEKTSSQPKSEMGLNLFTCKFQEDHGVIWDLKTPKFYYFSGIYYKYHFGKNGLRSNYFYSQKKLTESLSFNSSVFGSYWTSVTDVTSRNHEFKIGYQRSFGDHKLSPYVFTDLVFGYTNIKGQQITTQDGNPPVVTPLYAELFSLGISEGVGLRYNISKNIVISYEGGIMLYFSRFDNLAIPRERSPLVFTTSLAYNPVGLFGLSIRF